MYDSGTLVMEGNVPACVPPQFEWDPRVERFRAPAIARRRILEHFTQCAEQVEDTSSRARPLKLKLRTQYTPHPCQKEAIWLE